MDIIKVKNLTIKYNNNILVNNISFNVKHREIFGIVGESGSGKTLTAKVLLNMLPGNLNYKADEILFNNQDIKDISYKKSRELIGKKIGFIPQNTVFYLHPMIKIKNQIADGYIYHMKKSKKEAMEKSIDMLGKVGFENVKEIMNLYPWQLSGGMRQRVNIAMALMNDPELIIADEPTTALDSTIQKQILELFKKINNELGISIIMISHNLNIVKYYTDRISVMYAGQILENGKTKYVFENPKHPYTQMLRKSIPSMNIDKSRDLEEIKGYIKNLGRDKISCIFENRCPKAMDICKECVKENFVEDHYYKCNIL